MALVVFALAMGGASPAAGQPRPAAEAPRPAAAAPVAAPASARPPGAVDAMRARGHLLCGVAPSAPGFAQPDGRGNWRGLDVDYCRAVASAVLGDAAKARFVPVPASDRFEMLRRGEVDLLARNTTWTLERDAGEGVVFAGVSYYDGQGFMVRRDRGITRVQQLDGARICVEAGTTSAENLAEHARLMRLRLTPVEARSGDAVRAAFLAGYCDALTSDTASLAGFVAAQGASAGRLAILSEVISKEPLGPVVRQGDHMMFNVARWTLFAMLAAEELSLDSQAVGELEAGGDARIGSAPQEVQRLFGRIGRSGAILGLDAGWGARVVRQVGNYGEVWERNIGPLGIQRGLNLLWNQGGLQYAPPLR
jgi:general L-amino acid transport system substrate-binding protein